MRAALDAIYRVSGLAAGFFLVGIAALSLAQVGGRLLGRATHSYDEFAGYCMAASSFLGLAWTLRCNEHIRLTLLLGRLQGQWRRVSELACLAVAAAITAYFAWSTVAMVWTSFELNDVSQGLVPVKLWIPQSAMALGLVILLLAFVDDLVAGISGRMLSYHAAQPGKGEAVAFER